MTPVARHRAGAPAAQERAARLVLFDTAWVDLRDELRDSSKLLFGTQLGGGTHIHQALSDCRQIIPRPAQMILVLITDLYEGAAARACSCGRPSSCAREDHGLWAARRDLRCGG